MKFFSEWTLSLRSVDPLNLLSFMHYGYVEAEDQISTSTSSNADGVTRTPKGPTEVALKNFQTLRGTIRTYTAYTLNAFKDMATANVDKVTLEFGVKVAGEGGVPYITKGSGECNLKITVECSFANSES